MNVFKKIASFSVTLLLSNSLWAMDSQKNFLTDESRLSDLQPLILHYVDHYKSEGLSELWKELDDEAFWAPYVKGSLSDFADEFRLDGETWREAFLRFHNTFSHILSMKDWTSDNIEAAISYENFAELEKLLLKNLEIKTIASLGASIHSANDLLAALIAFNHIDVNASENAAWNIAADAALNAAQNATGVTGYAHWIAARDTTNNVSWKAAQEFIGYALYCAARHTEWSDAHDVARQVNRDIAREAAKNHAVGKLPKIPPMTEINDMVRVYSRLSDFIVLSYISQADFVEQHFIKTYNLTKAKLDAKQSFKISVPEILAIWFKPGWEKPELTENPYIAAFQRLAKTLASLVKN